MPDNPQHPDTEREGLAGALREAATIGSALGRSDLAARLEVAAARLSRPATVVCVVGEYKQGKSHIINALIGRDVCAVDDDLATAAITVIGHGDQPAAFVHRVDDGERVAEPIDPDEVHDLTAEGNAGVEPNIEMVEVAVPSPVLQAGLTLVDTPGVNAFRSGADEAVLRFLPYANALILVSDASAELGPPELAFLESARDACPTVLVALSKADLYPEWRRILELDRAHLTPLGLDQSVVPVASPLRDAAVREHDAALNRESGFPDLLAAVRERVMSANHEVPRARDELSDAIDRFEELCRTREADLRNPESAGRRLAELQEAQAAVAGLREASARWMVALNDGMADLRTDADYRLRTAVRKHLQDADRELADVTPKSEWDDFAAELRGKLASEADEIFDLVGTGIEDVAQRLAALIAEDVPASLESQVGGFSAEELWNTGERELGGDTPGPLGSAVTVLRGGYSGMLMLGMLGQLVGLAALAPVSIGVGVLFGARQFREERKRQLEKQRQEARGLVRQFIEQVQLELSNRVQRAVQEGHRSMRDHFGARIQELSAAAVNTAAGLQEAIAADDRKRAELLATIERSAAQLAALRAKLDDYGGHA